MSRGGAKPVDDQVKLKKLLDELTKREENKFCADCSCRGPRWASINLGVFICIACSGIHRSLGVHLTFVRSVNLDSWTSDQVAQMQKWGNGRAKEYYEANVPRDYRVPNEHSSVREKELWIREKYERKRFVMRDDDPRAKRRSTDSDNDGDSDDDDGAAHRRSGGRRTAAAPASSSTRTSSRTGSSSSRRHETPAAAAPVRSQPPVTQDILTFDAFNSPPPTPQAAAVPATTQQTAKPDEWATFAGSSGQTSSGSAAGFADAFAPTTPAPATQHVNKMANIMASFGSVNQQPTAGGPTNAFGGGSGPQGMMGSMMHPMAGGMGAPMGGMPMNPMAGGMGQMHPMAGGGMPMHPMGGMPMQPMGGMMQPNMMMQPMGGFPGGGAPQMGGFPGGPQMGMGGPSGGGMMHPMGGFPPQQQQQQPFQQGLPQQHQQFQQQHQFQQQQQPPPQQQQQQGGLNQPFVNLGGGGKNPFF